MLKSICRILNNSDVSPVISRFYFSGIYIYIHIYIKYILYETKKDVVGLGDLSGSGNWFQRPGPGVCGMYILQICLLSMVLAR